ncbi:aspartyl-tRNA synthetase (tRNA synthetase class II) [Colletotrichum sojae]|uniref:Aspartyl-tRNA synthetase (tRNA synthetase class II) n=1 Tax=Colletotrichum sojae TaxID=2175907 RepID=A0A8H6N3G3_9PEZI|nr:aspartyl-tRNA synthetase (tRNA synthetase class II) [Colletotrichum sojae]
MLRQCCRRSRALAALRAQTQPAIRSLAVHQRQACVTQQVPSYARGLSTTLRRAVDETTRGPAEETTNKAADEANKPAEVDSRHTQLVEELKKCFAPPHMSSRDTWDKPGTRITVSGHIGRARKVSKNLAFANIERNGKKIGQLCAKGHHAAKFNEINPFSAVLASGVVTERSSKALFEIDMHSIQHLNPFPKDIIIGPDTVFPPEDRHLQLRFHEKLMERLRFRAELESVMGQAMKDRDFMKVDTPILFKSTSEGAREFIVPTRHREYAFALPQSPQQYKQVLMTTGMAGYYQFARCFRDEDHRADRQPEFTQLDMEKAWATGATIMEDVEYVVGRAWDAMRDQYVMEVGQNSFAPFRKESLENWEQSVQDGAKDGAKTPRYQEYPTISTPFLRMKYTDCMDLYGSDKPDLRIPNSICRVDQYLNKDFVSMITDLESPVVEAWKISPREGADRKEVWKFVTEFMENLPKSLKENPDGAPTALMFDSRKPLNGFSSLGPEGLEAILDHLPEESGFSDMENGDIVLFQARKDKQQQGGSTKLGETRIALYHAAVEAGLVERNDSFKFLWVTDFPMFTPEEEGDVGQGGESGFSATHHPFTAPHSEEDYELLLKDPLKAKADHYDLVLNGVELGGGSRRIHVAWIQEFIFRNILKMSEDSINDFSHLLKALRDACPPHAGFAIGFDRFVAVLSGTSSVRDVIAFPKNNNGTDEFGKMPTKMSKEKMETYHLEFAKAK